MNGNKQSRPLPA